METALPARAPGTYMVCRVGLIVFGAGEILVGFNFLLAARTVVTLISGIGYGTLPLRLRILIGAEVVGLSLTALTFFIAGIGSILRRNWARIASLVVSSIWLLMGMGSLIVAFLLPRLEGERTTMHNRAFIAVLVLGVLFTVVMPSIFVAFYSRPSVSDACLARPRP